jgi:DNA-directed RNA polymerase subunit RPC12/RpoP
MTTYRDKDNKMAIYCAKCGKDITDGAQFILNLEDDENDLEMVCRGCHNKANPKTDPLCAAWAAIRFAIRNPQLASQDELLDCLVHKDVDLDDRIVIVDELRRRLRDGMLASR